MSAPLTPTVASNQRPQSLSPSMSTPVTAVTAAPPIPARNTSSLNAPAAPPRRGSLAAPRTLLYFNFDSLSSLCLPIYQYPCDILTVISSGSIGSPSKYHIARAVAEHCAPRLALATHLCCQALRRHRVCYWCVSVLAEFVLNYLCFYGIFFDRELYDLT